MDKFDDAYRQKVAAVVRGVLAAKYAKDDNVPIKIEEGLFLGSVRVVQNMEALKELNITHILTVAHFLTLAHPDDFTYKTIEEIPHEPISGSRPCSEQVTKCKSKCWLYDAITEVREITWSGTKYGKNNYVAGNVVIFEIKNLPRYSAEEISSMKLLTEPLQCKASERSATFKLIN